MITFDGLGFGRSSKTSIGYDTFAADLDKLLKKPVLKNVALVEFSMGSGEVTQRVSERRKKNSVPTLIEKNDPISFSVEAADGGSISMPAVRVGSAER